MTKKEYVGAFIAFMAVILACSFVASDFDAVTITDDGVVYELTEGGGEYYAEAAAYDGYSQSVVIKAFITYDGVEYPVVFVAENSFNCLNYYSEAQPGTSEEDKAKRSNIKSITIEDNNELQLSPQMFEALPNLESITIGEGITVLPEQFLYKCKNLSTIALPSTLEVIDVHALSYLDSLKSIQLNDGLKSLKSSVFYGSALTSIDIPDSVETIGSLAFRDCFELSEVTLGEGLTIIYDGAFAKTAISSIFIPANVTSIRGLTNGGQGTFPDTLQSIIVSDDNEVYYSSPDGKSVYTKADGHIVYYLGGGNGEFFFNYDIPNNYLRDSTEITKITFLDGATTIGNRAFTGCSNLKEVVMCDSITSMGTGVFGSCSSLESVILSKNLTTIPMTCFSGCAFADFDLSNITEIGRRAFMNCANLTLDSLPDGLQSIGSGAFWNCPNVSISSLPSGVTLISAGTFMDSGITSMVLGDGKNAVTLEMNDSLNGDGPIFRGSALRSVTLDNVVLTGVNPRAIVDFATTPNFEEISFGPRFTDVDFITSTSDALTAAYPDKYVSKTLIDGATVLKLEDKLGAVITIDGVSYTLTSLDPAKCSVTGYEGKITSISIPATIDFYGSEAQVVSIGAKAFYGCDTLVSADLGSVTSVGMKAFAHCVKLTTLDVGDSLKTISAYAFYRCLKLADINLDDSVATLKTYGSYSFYKCGKLSSMVVPSTMSTIGTKAFTMTFADENGAALEASLASLKGYEYSNFDGVLVRQSGPEIGSEFTSGNLTYKVLSVLPNKVEVVGYSGKITSLDFSEAVTDGEYSYSVTAIGENAFYKCRTLTSANLGDAKVIGTQAFYGCNKLTSVEADGLVTVGIKAFAYCYALSTLDLGDSLKTIRAYGFYRCESLTSFDAPSTLKTIGSYAFYKCTALGEFHSYGSSLKTIGNKAFGLCTSITYMDFPTTLNSVESDSFDGMTIETAGRLPWIPEPVHDAAYFAGYKFTGTYPSLNRSMQPLS